ncbi:hypothetical protein T484DRAFT_1771639, partial [Baffinella frigidus]
LVERVAGTKPQRWKVQFDDGEARDDTTLGSKETPVRFDASAFGKTVEVLVAREWRRGRLVELVRGSAQWGVVFEDGSWVPEPHVLRQGIKSPVVAEAAGAGLGGKRGRVDDAGGGEGQEPKKRVGIKDEGGEGGGAEPASARAPKMPAQGEEAESEEKKQLAGWLLLLGQGHERREDGGESGEGDAGSEEDSPKRGIKDQGEDSGRKGRAGKCEGRRNGVLLPRSDRGDHDAHDRILGDSPAVSSSQGSSSSDVRMGSTPEGSAGAGDVAKQHLTGRRPKPQPEAQTQFVEKLGHEVTGPPPPPPPHLAQLLDALEKDGVVTRTLYEKECANFFDFDEMQVHDVPAFNNAIRKMIFRLEGPWIDYRGPGKRPTRCAHPAPTNQ